MADKQILESLRKLEEEIRRISEKLQEVADRLSPPEPWAPTTSQPAVTSTGSVTCPKCGMTFSGAFSYYCPNSPCPLGIGAVAF